MKTHVNAECKMFTALFGCMSIKSVCSGNELIALVMVLALVVFCCMSRTGEVGRIRQKNFTKKSNKKKRKKK